MDEAKIEQLQTEIDNLKKIIFRLIDFNLPELDAANIKQYLFINDESVRRQLELDFLRMMHTPVSNFNQYCLYSFYQIENLLNYYYSKRFKEKEEMIKYFSFTSNPENEKIGSRVSEIKYSTKWIKFSQEFLQEGLIGKIQKRSLNFDIQKIAYVRNTSIHRNTKDIKDHEDDIFSKYIELLPKHRNYSEKMRAKSLVQEKEKLSDEEKKYYYTGLNIDFKRKENFSLVKRRTLDFVEIIKSEILKVQ